MLSEDGFHALARDIARLNNIPLKLALEYTVHIGDTPELDENDLVIVRNEQGKEIARVILPFDD